MDSTEKYPEISEKLRNLETIRASDDFVSRLNSTIVEIEAQKRTEHFRKFDEGKGGFLRNLFGNRQYPWLIPAVGFTILIFFVFYVTYQSRNSADSTNESISQQSNEQLLKNNETQNNKTTENIPPAPVKTDNSIPEKEKTVPKDIAGNLEPQNPEKIEKPQQPVNDGAEIVAQETDLSKTRKTETESSKLSLKENISGQQKGPDVNDEGKTGFQPASEQSTAEKRGDGIVPAIAVTGDTRGYNPLDKLNEIDKSNLEILKNKISDN